MKHIRGLPGKGGGEGGREQHYMMNIVNRQGVFPHPARTCPPPPRGAVLAVAARHLRWPGQAGVALCEGGKARAQARDLPSGPLRGEGGGEWGDPDHQESHSQ